MCTVLLLPGDNPIAVNKYINQSIKEPGCEYVDRIRPVPNWILKGALLNMTMKMYRIS
jgi:hypothetical protein